MIAQPPPSPARELLQAPTLRSNRWVIEHAAPLLRCALLLGCLSLPRNATGEVFARLPKSPVPLLAQLGGKTVQASDVRVNGTPGKLTVLGFEMSAQGVCGALAAALARPDLAQAGSAGALLFPWPGGKGPQPQVLVLASGTADRALAVVIDLPPDAPDSPPAWPWGDIAPPPSFGTRLSVEDADARTSLVTGASPLEPEHARSEAAEILVAAGWAPATPAADVASTALFARGTEVLVLTVLPPEAPGDAGSRILLLRRRPQ